jgi:hypothetical protein
MEDHIVQHPPALQRQRLREKSVCAICALQSGHDVAAAMMWSHEPYLQLWQQQEQRLCMFAA